MIFRGTTVTQAADWLAVLIAAEGVRKAQMDLRESNLLAVLDREELRKATIRCGAPIHAVNVIFLCPR